MTRLVHSFTYGWRIARRLWPIVVLTYLAEAIFAGAMAGPVASQISVVFGHSAMAADLTGPVTLDWLLELGNGADLSGFPWLLYLIAPIVSALITTFLRGGMLGALSGGSGQFTWRQFFSDCGRYFWRLLVILLLIVPAFLLFILVSLMTLRVGFGPGGGLDLAPAFARGILGLLLLFLLPAILDYARISLVLEPRRSLFRHIGRSLKFVVLRFPAMLLLGLAFWACALAIAALWPAALALFSLQMGFIAAFMIQQVSAILASWQRVAMLGGEMNLFENWRCRCPRSQP